METTKSADGTVIAYERTGDGPPLIVAVGAFCDRRSFVPAEGLTARFTVYTYDRRGRGDSGDTGDLGSGEGGGAGDPSEPIRSALLRQMLDAQGFNGVRFRLSGESLSLWGKVHSSTDRETVEEEASTITGAMNVEDHLEIEE